MPRGQVEGDTPLGGLFPYKTPHMPKGQWEGKGGVPGSVELIEGPDKASVPHAFKENPPYINQDHRGLDDDRVRSAMVDRAVRERVGVGVASPYDNKAPESFPRGGESTVAFARVTITSAEYTNAFLFYAASKCSKLNLWVETNAVVIKERTTMTGIRGQGVWGEEYPVPVGFLSIERRWLEACQVRNLESGKNGLVTLVFVTAPDHMFTHQVFR